MLNNIYKKYEHAFRFILVGSLNTLVDLGFFFVIANVFRIEAVLASIVSTGIAMCLSFFLNHEFVFNSQYRKRDTIVQFLGITAFNVWLIQSIVIVLALYVLKNISIISSHKWTLNLMAKLCGVAVSFVLNYTMYKFLFHKRPGKELVA